MSGRRAGQRRARSVSGARTLSALPAASGRLTHHVGGGDWTSWYGWGGSTSTTRRRASGSTLAQLLVVLGVVLVASGAWATGYGALDAVPVWWAGLRADWVARPAAPLADPSALPASFAGVSVRPLLPEPAAAPPLSASDSVHMPAAPEIVSAMARPWLDTALQDEIEAAIPPGTGTVAVAVRHVSTGASAGINAGRVMTPASTYKLGVLVEAARQIEADQLSLDEKLLLLPEDWDDGAGVLQGHIGDYVTVGEALRLMITISDNTAALAINRRLGANAVNQLYDELGLSHTRQFTDEQPATATAWELATLLSLLTSGQAAEHGATEYALALLAQEQPQAWIAAGTPPGVVVAHKSGQLPGIRNDAALVYTPSGPYALVVLTDNLDDDADGEALIAAVASAVYAHFNAWLGSVPIAAP